MLPTRLETANTYRPAAWGTGPRSDAGFKPPSVPGNLASLVFFAIVVLYGAFIDRHHNELDVLAVARHAADPAWLANDWYLSLPGGYRTLFNTLSGTPLRLLGLEAGVFFVRCVEHALLAFACWRLFRRLGAQLAPTVTASLLFFNHQSLVAGETLMGGAEAKLLAYALIIVAIEQSLARRFVAVALLCSGAVAAHVVVGLQGSAALGLALLLTKRLPRLSAKAWVGAAAAIALPMGVIAREHAAFSSSDDQGWTIYVLDRNPHHLLPEHWPSGWILPAICCLLVLCGWRWLTRHSNRRFVATVTLSSLPPALVGFAVWTFADPKWLRFYWFRVADVFLPLGVALLLALLLSDLARSRGGRWFSLVCAVGVVSYTFAPSVNEARLTMLRPEDYRQGARLSSLLPKDAIVAVNPEWSAFYIQVERATVATFKHGPQTAPAMIEWKRRLLALTGRADAPLNTPLDRKSLSQRFAELTQQQAERLAQDFGATHIVTGPHNDWTLPVVGTVDQHVVYRLSASASAAVR